MKRFVLDRAHDVSGISGVGVVAWGVEFPDGTVTLRWRASCAGWASTVNWPCIEAVEEIHGHNGATRIVWVDNEPSELAQA